MMQIMWLVILILSLLLLGLQEVDSLLFSHRTGQYFRKGSCAVRPTLEMRLSRHDSATDDYPSSGLQPLQAREAMYADCSRLLKSSSIALLGSLFVMGPKASSAAAATVDEALYIDKQNKFAVKIPPSWSVMRRQPPAPTMTKYKVEDSLFIASSFAEGSSMGITRTVAPRLLKDFNIEWWFAPLTSMSDVGPADLTAKLLIMQRQGDFEKQDFPNKIVSAEITGDSALVFEFTTPIIEGVERKTLAKGYLRGNELILIWVSALASVVDGDYGPTLRTLRDSFVLV